MTNQPSDAAAAGCSCGSAREESARFGQPHLPWCYIAGLLARVEKAEADLAALRAARDRLQQEAANTLESAEKWEQRAKANGAEADRLQQERDGVMQRLVNTKENTGRQLEHYLAQRDRLQGYAQRLEAALKPIAAMTFCDEDRANCRGDSGPYCARHDGTWLQAEVEAARAALRSGEPEK